MNKFYCTRKLNPGDVIKTLNSKTGEFVIVSADEDSVILLGTFGVITKNRMSVLSTCNYYVHGVVDDKGWSDVQKRKFPEPNHIIKQANPLLYSELLCKQVVKVEKLEDEETVEQVLDIIFSAYTDGKEIV